MAPAAGGFAPPLAVGCLHWHWSVPTLLVAVIPGGACSCGGPGGGWPQEERRPARPLQGFERQTSRTDSRNKTQKEALGAGARRSSVALAAKHGEEAAPPVGAQRRTLGIRSCLLSTHSRCIQCGPKARPPHRHAWAEARPAPRGAGPPRRGSRGRSLCGRSSVEGPPSGRPTAAFGRLPL